MSSRIRYRKIGHILLTKFSCNKKLLQSIFLAVVESSHYVIFDLRDYITFDLTVQYILIKYICYCTY
jgi:hypothetical protein